MHIQARHELLANTMVRVAEELTATPHELALDADDSVSTANDVAPAQSMIGIRIRGWDWETFDPEAPSIRCLFWPMADDDKVLYVERLEVEPEGRGLGKRFYVRLFEEAKKAGYTRVMTQAAPEVVGFALKVGYHPGPLHLGARCNFGILFGFVWITMTKLDTYGIRLTCLSSSASMSTHWSRRKTE